MWDFIAEKTVVLTFLLCVSSNFAAGSEINDVTPTSDTPIGILI